MAKELGVYRTLGYGTAVYGDILLMLACRVGVYNLWEELLTHATLSSHQYREVGGCYAHRHLERRI